MSIEEKNFELNKINSQLNMLKELYSIGAIKKETYEKNLSEALKRIAMM